MRERGRLAQLTGPWSGSYFLFPLQVYCDAQLEHSPFASMEEAIHQVLSSFAVHAPADARLVIKHHPMDRPYREYGAMLRAAHSGAPGARRMSSPPWRPTLITSAPRRASW